MLCSTLWRSIWYTWWWGECFASAIPSDATNATNVSATTSHASMATWEATSTGRNWSKGTRRSWFRMETRTAPETLAVRIQHCPTCRCQSRDLPSHSKIRKWSGAVATWTSGSWSAGGSWCLRARDLQSCHRVNFCCWAAITECWDLGQGKPGGIFWNPFKLHLVCSVLFCFVFVCFFCSLIWLWFCSVYSKPTDSPTWIWKVQSIENKTDNVGSCWHSLHTSVKDVQEREWIIDGEEDIPAMSHVLSNASQEPPAIKDVQMPPPWWLSQKSLNPFSVFAVFAFDCHLTFLCGLLLDACSPGLFQQMTSHPKTFHRTTSMLWSLKRNGTCPYMRWLLLRVF